MSRGDGRALEAMAEALYETAPVEMRTNLEGGAIPWERAALKGDFRRQAQAAYDAVLDALLSELPPEAVEAGAWPVFVGVARAPWTGRGDDEACPVKPITKNECRNVTRASLQAALLSLRSSSRGANR